MCGIVIDLANRVVYAREPDEIACKVIDGQWLEVRAFTELELPTWKLVGHAVGWGCFVMNDRSDLEAMASGMLGSKDRSADRIALKADEYKAQADRLGLGWGDNWEPAFDAWSWE